MSTAELSAPSGRPLPPPFVAVVAYTLRACLPMKRWFGVLLPCAGALLFGWLATVDSADGATAYADVAEVGLFRLVLPLTCLIIGDAVLGADVRAGTFQLTWLSPVRFGTIAAGRWFGGWIVALVSLVPALAIAPVIAGVPDAALPMAVAGIAGSGAYIALFLVIGVLVRRSALWSLAIVLLGEWLLGTQLSGIAQLSPLWLAQQTFAGLWDDGATIERDGVPTGASAIVRLALIAVVCLVVASRRLARMRPHVQTTILSGSTREQVARLAFRARRRRSALAAHPAPGMRRAGLSLGSTRVQVARLAFRARRLRSALAAHPAPMAGGVRSCCEHRGVVGEGLELEGVPRRIAHEHRPLLARLAGEA